MDIYIIYIHGYLHTLYQAKAFKVSETDDERRSRKWQRQLTLRCTRTFRAADRFTSPPPQKNRSKTSKSSLVHFARLTPKKRLLNVVSDSVQCKLL